MGITYQPLDGSETRTKSAKVESESEAWLAKMSEGLQIKMYAQHLHHWAVLYKLYI